MEKEPLVIMTMSVGAGLREQLKQLAAADKRPLSNYLRIVLTEHVNQCQSNERTGQQSAA